MANARKEVILGAGSFDTPHLLQVSGVGSRKLLENFDACDTNIDISIDRNAKLEA